MPAARGVEAGRAYLRLLLDTAEADGALTQYEQRFRSQLLSFSRVSAQIAGIGAAISAPFIAATKVASNAQETFSKFEAVLGPQTEAARRFLETFSGSGIQSIRQAEDTFASLFAQLTGVGLPAEEARRQVELLTSAVADFESFANLNTGEGLTKIASALAGEVEPLRRFGIELSASRVSDELRSQGKAAGEAADGAEKLRARIRLLLSDFDRLSITGDVDRTFDSLANQSKALRASLEDLGVAVGSSLVPSIETLVPALIRAVDLAAELAQENPNLTQTAAASGAALLVFGTGATGAGFAIARLLPYLTTGVTAAKAFGAALLGLASVPAIVLAAVAGGLLYGINEVQEANDDLTESVDRLTRGYEDYAERIREINQFEVSPGDSALEASAKYRQAAAETAAAIRELNEAINETDPSSEGAVATLQSKRAGLRRSQKDLAAGGDPAIGIIQRSLQEEVVGGTAEDPRARLAELRAVITELQGLYRVSGNFAQAEAFRQLERQAANVVPSLIGGRDAPVLPGTDDGDAVLSREADQRERLLIDSERRVAEAREALIEDAHQRELARIERERRERIGAAQEIGSPEIARQVNQQAELERELASRQEQKRRGEEQERLKADRERREATTNRFQLARDLAQVRGDNQLSDLEKQLASLELQSRSDLSQPDLTDDDRALIRRRTLLEQLTEVERAEVNRDRLDRQIRDEAFSSQLITQNEAAALAIGPSSGVDVDQLNELKKLNTGIDKLRRQLPDAVGIPGG